MMDQLFTDYNDALQASMNRSMEIALVRALISSDLQRELSKLVRESLVKNCGAQIDEIVKRSITKETVLPMIKEAVEEQVENLFPSFYED